MHGRHLLRSVPYLGLCSLGLLTACARGSSAPTTEPATPTPAAEAQAAAADPYHPPPRDTVEVSLYKAWQQYMLQCARCHGEDGQGTTFAPSLLVALRPDGHVPTQEEFVTILTRGREDKGMPSAGKRGVDSVY
ncbi:MAG TPA: cytochrome c, partial [Gemmatimonadales bacterium]|nr:cytochrome c [Gemmatimonadales bacterium]